MERSRPENVGADRSAGRLSGFGPLGTLLQLATAGGTGSSGLDRTADAPRVSPWDPSWAQDQDPLLRGVIDATALLAGLLLAGCGMVLASRRLAGAMGTAPGPAAILAACTGAVTLLLIADRGSRDGAARAAGGLARFGLLATVAAVALPLRIAAPAAAIAALVALGLAAAVVAPGITALTGRLVGRGFVASRRATAGPPVMEAMVAATTAAAAWDGSMRQRFERLTLADGTDCVRGRVRVSVAVGSRLGVAHVGFCPPLAVAPTVEATTDYDGIEAIVSAAEVLPWGVRIECRLDEPAEETIDIPVDVLATAPA